MSWLVEDTSEYQASGGCWLFIVVFLRWTRLKLDYNVNYMPLI